MVKRLFLLLAIAVSLLCSCSSGKTKQQVLNEKRPLLIELHMLEKSGVISESDFEQARQNIAVHGQRGVAKKLGWGLLMFISVIGLFTLATCNTGINLEEEITSPLKAKDSIVPCYVLGIFGCHFAYTRRAEWIFYLFWILGALAFISGYTWYLYFYNIPSLLFIHDLKLISNPTFGFYYCCQLLLIILLVINLATSLLTPYWIYRFNALYFRRNKEWDDILNGRTTETEKFYSTRLLPDIKSAEKNSDKVNKILKDADYVVSHPDDDNISGFWKNLITLGKTKKLKYKIQRLRALRQCCELLSNNISKLSADNEDLYSYLSKYRYAAYRNIYLAKELIKMVKDKIESQQQQIILDKFPEFHKPINTNPYAVNFNASSVAFDSDTFYSAVSTSFDCSLKRLEESLKNGKVDKNNLILEGAQIALETVINGICEIFEMNGRVSEALKENEYEIKQAEEYIGEALCSILKMKNEILRESEIMIALFQCNKAFAKAYDPLREKIFGRPSLIKAIMGIRKNEELIKSADFIKDLQHLIQLCSEYNKVNKATTGKDSQI